MILDPKALSVNETPQILQTLEKPLSFPEAPGGEPTPDQVSV